MYGFRKIAVVPVVALAAISIVIAGMPYSLCRCPNGRIKLFCLSSPSTANGCCCRDGSCCGVTRDAKSETRSCRCCARHEGDEAGTEPNVQSVQRNCCRKTQVIPEIHSLPEEAPPNTDGMGLSKPATANVSRAADVGTPNLAWQACRIPPPTDLITILQRLTI